MLNRWRKNGGGSSPYRVGHCSDSRQQPRRPRHHWVTGPPTATLWSPDTAHVFRGESIVKEDHGPGSKDSDRSRVSSTVTPSPVRAKRSDRHFDLQRLLQYSAASGNGYMVRHADVE